LPALAPKNLDWQSANVQLKVEPANLILRGKKWEGSKIFFD
jgi:hypothetical protein